MLFLHFSLQSTQRLSSGAALLSLPIVCVQPRTELNPLLGRYKTSLQCVIRPIVLLLTTFLR